MKAAVYRRYGGPEVVSIVDVPKPIPSEREVLIKTYAFVVNAADWRMRSLSVAPSIKPLMRLAMGITGPRKQILGTELSGVIEAVGAKVTHFKPGDAVFVDCGTSLGAHAEYITMAEDGTLAPKPANLSFEKAAALCFGGVTALYFITKSGGIKPGDKVLVNGASGTTGLAFVQLAHHFGAHVTGVSSAANHALLQSIGAQDVIDYRHEDFTKNGVSYDILIDTVETAPWARVKASLSETGCLLAVAGSVSDIVKAALVSRAKGRRLIPGMARAKACDLRLLAQLAEIGAFTPILDCVLPFGEIQAAHARVDSGRKVGSVVVTFEQPDPSRQ